MRYKSITKQMEQIGKLYQEIADNLFLRSCQNARPPIQNNSKKVVGKKIIKPGYISKVKFKVYPIKITKNKA